VIRANPILKAALLASTSVALTCLLCPAQAQDATWLANPGTADINTSSNWDTGTVPTGTAFFGTSATTALTLNTSATFDGWTFNAGAYTVTATYPAWVEFVGAGIVVNGGSVAITTGHVLIFRNASTAGSATINNTGNLSFNNSSSAGSAAITNDYSLSFWNSSTAGSATIINNYGLSFNDTATAGSATITNGGAGIMTFGGTSTAGSASITNIGSLSFNNASTAGNAQLINNGASATLDFSNSTGPNGDNKVSAGSIAGNGTFNLGANELTVGGNNLSTTVSGVISGSGGSLVKTGAGTMTLSGTNTYTGGTTFAGGTVSVSAAANLGDAAGGLTFNGGALQVTVTTFNSTARTMTLAAGGGTFDIANAANQFTVSEAISGVGGLTKSGAGTLILTAANTYSGATTINLGYLTIQDSIASSTITNNYGLVYSNSATAGSATITNHGELAFYNDATAGSASITNSASGIMYIRDNGTTSSATITNAGSIVFNDNSTAGSAAVTNNNELTFYGNTTAGSATITNSGTVLFDGNSTAGNAQLINSGSSAVVNFWTPGPASDGLITAGSLAGGGRFDLNSTELTVGSNNLSTEVTGVLTGDGLATGTSLIKTGTGMLTLSGTNTYTGATTVDGGTLLVNGSIADSALVFVNPGATLGGTGTVAATFLDSGATLAPGTPGSIGTLTVQGNLTFCNCSIYAVKVSPTGADKTVVTGQAALGGIVQATALAGSFRGQTYTILSATGGLVGTTFDSLTFTGSSISPGARNPHLTYDANNVYLVLDPGTLQLSSSASGNQTSVANGINSAVLNGGTPPAAFDALLNMSGAQLGSALNQVSGQPAAAGQQAAYNASNQFMTAMFDPFAFGRGLAGSGAIGDAPKSAPPGRSSLGAVSHDASRDVLSDPRLHYWGTVYGGNSSTSGSGGASDTTSRAYGIVAGADVALSRDTMLGFALGGGQSSFGVSDGLGSGNADMVQTGLFGKHTMGAAYVFAGLSYTYQDVTTNRTVTVSGADELEAKFDANTFGGRIEGGYRYATPFVGITPYAALQVTQINLPGYEESAISGSNAFALDYESNATTITRTELGARLDRAFKLDDALLTLRGRLAWAHDEGNDSAVSASFLSLPGSAFTVNGAVPSKDHALVSAGAEMKWLNDLSIAGTFEGEFSENTVGYAGKGAVRYAW
jgi:autotransporter-associated beta strand protein